MTIPNPTIGSPLGFSRRHEDGLWWWDAERPLVAHDRNQVLDVVAAAERRARAGETLWGYVAYEAASAFDPDLLTHPPQPGGPPLAFFAAPTAGRRLETGPWHLGRLRAEIGRPAYVEAIRTIQALIAAGTTYQVNFTHRLEAAFGGDPLGLFRVLAASQNVPGLAIDLGGHVIASASPELFLRRHGGHVEARPMKGTARRGLDAADDRRQAEGLRRSLKERAENLMIVDMVRNDLGRVATTGSVQVPRLFDLEPYPTVWQMTSLVTAESDVDLLTILRATFPCASITGAPKVRTMREILSLERSPRGIYTGLIGRLGPGADFDFDVAIRTACIDRDRGRLVYGVGSGVTWDSRPYAEHRECRAKARIVSVVGNPALGLFETMRVCSGRALWLSSHLSRLGSSARELGFLVPADAESQVRAWLARHPARSGRLRLLLERRGHLELTVQPLPSKPAQAVRLALAATPLPTNTWQLAHKTTDRSTYRHFLDAARRAHPDAEDVLLWDASFGITETTIANVAYRLHNRWWTPPAAGLLLPGVLRGELLRRGRLVERPLALDELEKVDDLVLISALRGLRRAVVAHDPPPVE